MPAWVECHTHSLFAGHRRADFLLRNAGVSYLEILEAGGGISSTVMATRAADDETLLEDLLARLDAFARRGVATVEVKTGYGLSTPHELRHLAIIARAAKLSPVNVVPTFLGAHAIPASHRDRPEAYVDEVIAEMLPEVARLHPDASCDVFCERGAFTLDQSRRILEAAVRLGLAIRIHAEELTHTGGAAMAAELGALSADHLDHIDAAGIDVLAKSTCVGVLLPGVTVFLDQKQRPPARALIDAGAAVALSTDFNPGSCHTQDLPLMTTLAATLFKMTPGEALWAVTRGAAKALALEVGQLCVGAPADLLALASGDYADLPYAFGAGIHAATLFIGGAPWPA